MQRRNVNTVLFVKETIFSLGDRIWNLVPKNFKCSKSFNGSRKKWTTT